MTTRLLHKSILANIFHDDVVFAGLSSSLPERLCLNMDSRLVNQGDVFIALKGDLNDGHTFIEDVHQKGASLIIAERAYKNTSPQSPTLPIVFVENTLKTFSHIARLHMRKHRVKKIAITGSNGKTTTKEMLKAALSAIVGREKVYSSFGNRNNHFGVPLSALEVTEAHHFAIFEMGMNHEGELQVLASIVEPDVSVITNISFAHGGNFEDGIVGVARAKGELFQQIGKTNGYAIVNLDDDRVVNEALRHHCQYISFGRSKGADIRIINHSPFTLDNQEVELLVEERESVKVLIPLAGAHHAYNTAAALAVVLSLGLSVKDAAAGIFSMEKHVGRMSITRSKEGFILINDGYNANPASMKAGILASHDFKAERRIAVIGAMGELGTQSDEHHFQLGQLLAQHFDHLFICGEEAFAAVLGAENVGFSKHCIVFAASSAELIEPLKKMLGPKDLVFIKGSYTANMGIVADALLLPAVTER